MVYCLLHCRAVLSSGGIQKDDCTRAGGVIMRLLSIFVPVLIIAALLLGPAVFTGKASAADPNASISQVQSESYIIYFKPGATRDRIQQIYQELGVTEEKAIPQIRAHVIKVGSAVPFDPTMLSGYSEIEAIELDFTARATDFPDDTLFDWQWGLQKIQAARAWEITPGAEDIIIAILDTGIDAKHPELASKVIAEKNFTGSETADDLNGHGTHVAGIAAAATDNNLGIAGLAGNARLMNVKVLGENGSGSYSGIVEGIIWAADNGADVINMSMYGGMDSRALQQVVDYAWNRGAVIVAAAGNSSSSKPTYPAYYRNCLGVAAVDPLDSLYPFSNYGNWVDVAAPGEAWSTLPGGSYGKMQGTSMAAPFVSGLAALAFAIASDTDGDGKLNTEVRMALLKGSDGIGVIGTGAGRINAWNTLSALLPDYAPAGSTFGYNHGDGVRQAAGEVLYAMRFRNTAGSGILTQLELLMNDRTPRGKVKMGVYADNQGKPGIRLLDAGEVAADNGRITISGLQLPVAADKYYWLAFKLEEPARVAYISGVTSDIYSMYFIMDRGTGPLPASFPLSGSRSSFSPYVMCGAVVTW